MMIGMTERFRIHTTYLNRNKTEGYAELKDNGQPILESECIEDVINLKNLLNELNDENTHIKQTIKEAYENERTSLGKSVLKQLLEQME